MQARNSTNRNVLFVIVDQLRADCVFGDLSKHVILPNIQRFMEEAVTFERHYSVTNPCGPSRTSILTGQYAMNHRSVRNGAPLRHDTPNIATEMRKSGYVPKLFGYTDTSQDPRAFDPDHPALKTYEYPMTGFEEVLEMRGDTSYPWQSYLKERGYLYKDQDELYTPVSSGDGPLAPNDPALYSAEDSDTAFLTNAFLDHMKTTPHENWFAHLTYIRPHPPLVAPAPYNSMYDPELVPLPVRLATAEDESAEHPYFDPVQRHTTPASFVKGFPDLAPTDENIRKLRAIYFGLATEVDHHFGRVVQFLKETGQYENTMIVFAADHGEMLGDRHSWGKMSVYDAAFHTPLIIRVPDNEHNAGARIGHIVESIDIAPTILDWVGQEIPNSIDGRSLKPFLNGDTLDDWKTYSFSELDFCNPVEPTLWQEKLGTSLSDSCLGILRDERFTLVEFAADIQPMLFDKKRLGELKNVADLPDYSTDLNRLTRKMLRHRMNFMDHTLSMVSITEEGANVRPRYG